MAADTAWMEGMVQNEQATNDELGVVGEWAVDMKVDFGIGYWMDESVEERRGLNF